MSSNPNSKSLNFINSTKVIFIANILVAVCNYVIVIFASQRLQSQYSVWIALIGVLSIFGAFTNGIFINLTRNIASLLSKSKYQAIVYSQIYETYILGKWKYSFVLLPTIALLVIFTAKGVDIGLAILTSLYLISNIYLGLKYNELLGNLLTRDYAISNLLSSLLRLISTFVFLNLGLGLYSLVLGLMVNIVSYWFLGKHFFDKYKQGIPIDHLNYVKPTFEVINILLTTSSLVLISLYLNIAPIIINGGYSNYERNLFAVLFSLGQIIHFGAIAGLDSLVAYVSNQNSKVAYYWSLLFSFIISIIGSAIVVLNKEFIFRTFGKSSYVGSDLQILTYLGFVCLFNLIYLSIQYLIANNNYRPLVTLIPGILITISSNFINWGQVFIGIQGGVTSSLDNFLFANLIGGVYTAIVLMTLINLKPYVPTKL